MSIAIEPRDQSPSLLERTAQGAASLAMAGALAHKGSGLIRKFVGPTTIASLFAHPKFFAGTAALGLFATSIHAFSAAGNWFQGRDVENSRRLLLSTAFNWVALGSVVATRLTKNSSVARSVPLIQGIAAAVGLAVDLFSLRELHKQRQIDPSRVTATDFALQAGLTIIFGFDQASREALAGIPRTLRSSPSVLVRPKVIGATQEMATRIVAAARSQGRTGKAVLDQPLWVGALILHSAEIPDGNSFRLAEYHLNRFRDSELSSFHPSERMPAELEEVCRTISSSFGADERQQLKALRWDHLAREIGRQSDRSGVGEWSRVAELQTTRMLRAAQKFFELGETHNGQHFGIELEFTPPAGDRRWRGTFVQRVVEKLEGQKTGLGGIEIEEGGPFQLVSDCKARPYRREKITIEQGSSRVEVEIDYIQGTGAPILFLRVGERLLKFTPPNRVDIYQPPEVLLRAMERNFEAAYARIAELEIDGIPIGTQGVETARRNAKIQWGWQIKDKDKRIVKLFLVHREDGFGYDLTGANCQFRIGGRLNNSRGGQYPDAITAINELRREAESGMIEIVPRHRATGFHAEAVRNNRGVAFVEEAHPTVIEMVGGPFRSTPESTDFIRTTVTALSELGAEGEQMKFADPSALQVHVEIPVFDTAGQVTPRAILQVMKGSFQSLDVLNDAIPASPHRRMFIAEPEVAFRERVLKGDLDQNPGETMHDWILRFVDQTQENTPTHFGLINFDNVMDYLLEVATRQKLISEGERMSRIRSGHHPCIPTVEFRRADTGSKRVGDRFILDPDSVVYEVSRIFSFAHRALNGLSMD